MKRGPKPKPLALKVVEGNPGKRRLPPPDPSTAPLGKPPSELTQVERAMWRRVARECPWLRKADRMLVETYCRAWIQMVVADRKLVQAVVVDADRSTLTPLQRMLDQARNACLRMMAEMGATASSRARVEGFGRTDPSADPAQQYFA